MSYRSRLLNRCFNLLYGPLVFLHEPVGACLFGPSWSGRRLQLVDPLDEHGRLVLDIGCGEGRLLAHLQRHGVRCIGVDSSPAMLSRARRRSERVVHAHAQALPLVSGSADTIVITYPGAWINDPVVWAELERVLSRAGKIMILLGGTVAHGRGSKVRNLLARVAYGSRAQEMNVSFPPGGSSTIVGTTYRLEDAWGTAFIWEGVRKQESGSFVETTEVC